MLYLSRVIMFILDIVIIDLLGQELALQEETFTIEDLFPREVVVADVAIGKKRGEILFFLCQ